MAYQIMRTDKANDQIRDIVLYRTELTGRADAGLDLLDKLEAGFNRLSEFPESGFPPRYAALRTRGYRVLIVEKYLSFYKVDKESETVTIYAVVDGRRDYLNLV
ncbi:MAG: type II toxin-antitoxin system RelE/ParE family toxin [Oscillospiraceae bacterium]|nr:type II toxin-antitoxin system RelE/ParE family toxin [Oscillospiraceae bacterium]